MKDFFVTLTGSKNNAGDYLIKFRANELFREFRPDREIVDLNAWVPLDNVSLDLINKSRALILLGGPALQYQMYPQIYPLVKSLDLIRVPIIMMGIGWKDKIGDWDRTNKYLLSNSTIKLLNKINLSKYTSSVRDYHTLNVLLSMGLKRNLMTGCPAYYSIEHINKEPEPVINLNKIAFSLGVSFIRNNEIELFMKKLIIKLKQYFTQTKFEIVFHHSLKELTYNGINNQNKFFLEKHRQFANWLEKNDIKYCDISGSANNLINYYSGCDLHIGYRVHAHIFMNSINKPSILISEDGRGKAINNVIGGLVLDGLDYNNSIGKKILQKLKHNQNYFLPKKNLIDDIVNNVQYEIDNNYPRLLSSKDNIKRNYEIMKKFLLQLP